MRRADEGIFVPESDVRIVVADRDESVHAALKKALGDVVVAGSRVTLVPAFSVGEACAALERTAVLVLEADLDAPEVLGALREDRGDTLARVIIRSGEADASFDEGFLERFQVDGFIDRADLGTPLRLYAAVRTALRAYAHASALQKQVDGLGQIAERLATVSDRGTLTGLLQPLCEDIASNCWTKDWLCVPFLDDLEKPDALVLGAGALAPASAKALLADARAAIDATPGPLAPLPQGRTAFKFLDPATRATAGVLIVGSPGPVPARVKALAQSLGHRLAIARQNLALGQKLEEEQEAAREVYNDRMGMLGRLAASVAHELNTPLGVAVHAASLVSEYETALRDATAAKEDPAPVLADLHEAVELIVRNVNAAASLVRSFKSMAVDQASDQSESFDPAKTIADSLASLAHLLKQMGQTVHLEAKGPEIRLTNNPGALSQVVNNLVLNASKHGYKDRPGEIFVRHRATEATFELEVEDRGAGMPQKDTRRLFEPFSTTAKDRGGSGLGMSIVHQIVTQAYKGRITVESAPGKGTTFRVSVPRETPA